MLNRQKATPKYRRHKPTNQAVVTLSGKDHYLGPWRSKASREEYDRLVGEWILNGRSLPPGDDDITVVEVCNAYRKFAKRYYVKNGKPTREVELVREVLTGHVTPLYGRVAAIEFGPKALKNVRQRMIEADHSRGFINKNVDRIRRMFRWAAAEELIPASVPQALSMVPGLRKGRCEARETLPVMPVDQATIEATLAHLPVVVGDMVRLAQFTGARPGEICILRPCDVDTSGDVWHYRPESHKGEHFGRERIVCIGPKAQDVLRPYLLRSKTDYCFDPRESEKRRRELASEQRTTPLSCGNRPGTNRKASRKRPPGSCYTTNSFRRAIHRGCQLAKVKAWGPHRLRHTAATEIRKSYGIEGAAVALGHASAGITEVYAERDQALATRIAREVG